MRVLPTKIPEVILNEPDVFNDERGFSMEAYQARRFSKAGISVNFVQDNHSRSIKNTLRGLHYQIQHPQAKLVRVVYGQVFDVAVDIRRSSPSFGKWIGEMLSAENKRQIWIPEGFAHGIYILSDWADVIYKVSDYYSPESERTIIWNDPTIEIEWPLLDGLGPILSSRDAKGILLGESELFT
jgi:dTDP-4-dehydrorhamnose 3,5-epimerase